MASIVAGQATDRRGSTPDRPRPGCPPAVRMSPSSTTIWSSARRILGKRWASCRAKAQCVVTRATIHQAGLGQDECSGAHGAERGSIRVPVFHPLASVGARAMSFGRIARWFVTDRDGPMTRHCVSDLRQSASEQRRFGYRRRRVLLRGEGHILNRKKTSVTIPEGGLSVRRRRGRKRATGSRARSWSRRGRTRVGHSTSSTTSSARAALPHPERHRRRHEGVPCCDSGHLDLGTARSSRTRMPSSPAAASPG